MENSKKPRLRQAGLHHKGTRECFELSLPRRARRLGRAHSDRRRFRARSARGRPRKKGALLARSGPRKRPKAGLRASKPRAWRGRAERRSNRRLPGSHRGQRGRCGRRPPPPHAPRSPPALPAPIASGHALMRVVAPPRPLPPLPPVRHAGDRAAAAAGPSGHRQVRFWGSVRASSAAERVWEGLLRRAAAAATASYAARPVLPPPRPRAPRHRTMQS